MNKVMSRLANEAGLGWDDKYQWYVGSESLEKYTKLVVQTCLTQIALIDISNFENDENGDIGWTCTASIDMIKEKFGIET